MIREFKLFDDNNEVIAHNVNYGTPLKEGWIVMYKEPLRKMIIEDTEYSKVRVFIYLSTLQNYDSLIITTVANIARELKLSYKTTWLAVRWLEEKEYIKRTERDGITGFMLNPTITSCGKKSIPERAGKFGIDLSSFSKKNRMKLALVKDGETS